MSKTELKKYLQLLSKEEVIEKVLELYCNCKPAKEYLHYLSNPDEKGKFKKYKAIIINEFYPEADQFDPSLRFSVAKKAIADFRVLKPSPLLLADLLVTLPETACRFTNEYGDMSEPYYNSTVTNFGVALNFLQKNNLLENFKLRCLDCVNYAEPCGYGFADEISQLFYDYYV